LDVEAVRADFPILQQRVNHHPLVYLDSAATTQKPRAVIQALVDFYETSNANIHRGIHTLAERATASYEGVRAKAAAHIGAGRDDEMVFTRNTTEALNLVAHAWGTKALRPGDEIVLTEMEHHSNIVPWQLLATRTGARLRYVPITAGGYLDMSAFRQTVTARTRLISVVHMSNVLGTINPIAEIAELGHRAGALVVVDGAQSVPHLPLDVETLGCDALAFSAHKMLGPTGVGVLWAKYDLLEAWEPFLGGGDMIAMVKPEASSWADVPHKFEAGTPNIADVVAFGAALDYLADLGMEAVRGHEIEITAYALDRLATVPGLTLHGPTSVADRGGLTSFALEGIHPHDVSTILDTRGIAIRAGHHCAQVLMRRLGVAATSRASFAVHTTRDEIDALVDGLHHVRAVMLR
jgi:cysteine desulfurase/selenocysteine lyase